MPKTMTSADVRKHADIESDEDGWWAYCHSGWQNADEPSHTFHEDTRAELLHKMRVYMRPCTCEGCQKDAAAS